MKILYKIWSRFLNELSIVRVDKFPFWVQLHSEGYKIRGIDTDSVRNTIKKGDVLVRGYDHYLGSLLVGRWSHVAICIDSNTVIHAIGTGVNTENIIDFCRCDRIAVFRPDLSPEDKDVVIDTAKSFIGTPYDYKFKFNDDHAFSCTEFVYRAFLSFRLKLHMSCQKSKLFGCIVKPVDMFKYTGFIKVLEIDKE